MSEETDSSVPSGETAKPEPAPEPSVSAPPKGGKRKLWIMIAAVAVVALLIGSVVWIMFLAPMKVTMEPTGEELSVDAGKVLRVSVKVKKGLSDITDNKDVKYLWTVLPNNLGSWQKRAEAAVNLTAGKAEGSGDITCKVTYKGEEVTVSKSLTVNPPYLDQILVSPPTKTLERGRTQVFTASAIDSVASPIEGLSFSWSVGGTVTGEINSTTGKSVLFTAGSTYGDVTLTATATYEGVTKSGSASITIGPLPPRNVDYYWYDMFNVPFGEWWDMRAVVGKTEVPLTHEYPYLFQWNGFPEGNSWVYSNMRLNITGRNMSDINMNERPEFLPLHGNARGGTADIRWYMQYLTSDEMKRFPDATSAWNDGWVVSLNGTVTMDEQAALSVLLGLTAEGFDDFSSWWSLHKTEIKTDFGNWFKYEAGKDRLDIFPAYDYAFTTLAWDISAEKVGDKIVLRYDLVTWGVEMLMAMWMREGFMPCEWYYEDMYLNASIGPEWTTLDINTAVVYAVYAYEATNVAGEPCWAWEALLQDYVVATPPENRESLYNKYADKTYYNTGPGSAWYGKNMTYDYVPGAFNLSENETLRLKWPSGEQQFKVHVSSGVTANYSDYMIVNFSEPMMSDADDLLPGTVVIDNNTHMMVFTGPIDMWHWSQQTTNPDHAWLSDEWERMELLPYGIPYIEFNPAAFGKVADQLVLSATSSWEDWDDPMVVVGDTVDLKVKILDQFGGVFIPYEGTVEFSTNGTGVTLPADYTFSVGDGGIAVVPGLSFSQTGWYTLTVTDTNTSSGVKSGSLVNIYVVAAPPVIDHFTIEVPGISGIVIPGLPTDVHVWAHNQYDGRVFKKYMGTVTFSTNATPGTYTLPANYTFGGAAAKGYVIIPGLVFTERGMYSLSVADTVVTTATGTTSVTVSRPAKIDYKLYDMFEEPWGEWWPYRLKSWKTDIILNNESHAYTMVYNPDMINRHGLIMAPYRWNVTATNMSTISVYDPSIMPTFGPDVEGASVYLDLYWQYINKQWWNDYIMPTWSSHANWSAGLEDLIVKMEGDGYYILTVYTIHMNREAAETWLNMPQAADPLTWWAANGANYQIEWQRWIDVQGNVEFDIYPGYEWAYVDVGTMMNLAVDGSDVVLTIGHFNWGFETLITRWMTDRAICNHEPYMEDFQMIAQFESEYGNVTYDAVAQYNLHAVKANLTDSDAAWVWEPQHIDYISWEGSEFNPWTLAQYTSWNSGDLNFGTYADYDFTPTYFNLTSYMTLTVQLPNRDDVIGYRGIGLPFNSISRLKQGNDTAYKNIQVNGPMWLGYHSYPDVVGAPNLASMYNNTTKVLFMQGPLNFANYLQPNDTGAWLLYHSAPWIEFNVANYTWPGGTMLSMSGPGVSPAMEGSASTSMSAAMVALAIALVLSIVATVLVVAEVRRRD